MLTSLESAVGKQIRSCHPYAYQTGKWATVVAVVPCRGKDMWLLSWEDGKSDIWNPEDPVAKYEWRDTP